MAASTTAHAQQPQQCKSVKLYQDEVKARHGVWLALTNDQWQFLRGIYALNPLTPLGLPPGSGAALVSKPGEDDGFVLFIDDGQVCAPMRAPKALMDMIEQIKSKKAVHVGSPL